MSPFRFEYHLGNNCVNQVTDPRLKGVLFIFYFLSEMCNKCLTKRKQETKKKKNFIYAMNTGKITDRVSIFLTTGSKKAFFLSNTKIWVKKAFK